MLEIERRGVPAAMVATTAFEEAYAAQAEVLGFHPTVVWVPHPIQNRTDEEIRAIADEALARVLAAVSTAGPG